MTNPGLTWLTGLAVAALVAMLVIKKCKQALRARALNCKAPVTLFPGVTGAITMIKQVRAGKLVEYIASLHEAHGPTFKERMIGNNLISTIEPANIKALLATQFNDFGLGIRHAQFYPLLGDGIFTLDGAGWSTMRRLTRPQFAREQVWRTQVISVDNGPRTRANGIFRLRTSLFSTDMSPR